MPRTVRRATSMSTCRETARSPESAAAINGRPPRASQVRTRRTRSARFSTSFSVSPLPMSQKSTLSQRAENVGSESAARISMSGRSGGGEISHTPARCASASRSAVAGAESRAQLKPSRAIASSGSPWWSRLRGKKGSPPTSKTPRVSAAVGDGTACAGAAASVNAAGRTANSPPSADAGGWPRGAAAGMTPCTRRSSIDRSY